MYCLPMENGSLFTKTKCYYWQYCCNSVGNIEISIYTDQNNKNREKNRDQGPVVQSIVSLTSSLRVISLTVLADSIYNILIFFAEKM